jgi:hypothetical protein
MIVRGDYCTLRFIGGHGGLIIDGPRASWHCRVAGLDSNAGGGRPFLMVAGPNYKLCDPSAGHIGTVLNFSLNKVNTDAVYQISTPSQTFAGTVTHLELNGKTVYPLNRRNFVLPPGPRMQSAGGDIAGIGDNGYVKPTPVR